jgi:hypothetical protein
MDKGNVMSDREAFEVFACDMDRDWNITCDLRGDYISAVTSGAWESWQASRQALSSCSENPNSSDADSRQAIDGEPAAVINKSAAGDYEFFPAPGAASIPNGIHKLYTRPASADVSDWEAEAKRAFWTGLEIGASMGAVSIAPRWNEYIAKRKGEMGPNDPAKSVSTDRPSLGQRKAAQVGPVIGVLVQNQEGRVCAVTDMGRCTWLSEDVTGAGDEVKLPYLMILDDEPNPESPESVAYVSGWNDCREKVLEYTPTKADEPLGVPDSEYIIVLEEAFKIILADANSSRNYGSLYRIGIVLAKLKDAPSSADVPDLFWNCGDIDSGDRGIDHVVSVIADGMDLSSTDTFPIMRAKRLSDCDVCITVDSEGDVQWKWAEQKQEQGQ